MNQTRLPEGAMVLTKDDILIALSASPPLIDGMIDASTQLQPNGVDLTVSSILKFQGEGRVSFGERELPNALPMQLASDSWVQLLPGCYLVQFNETINLPNDIIAIGKPRSTMLRMGATIETAVWDAGYSGRSQSLLVVFNPYGIEISENARVLQLIFIRLSRKTEGYSGIYQREGI